MIIYDLACDNEHRFEGWFRSADDFAAQQERQLVSCPHCDSSDVRRVPSAVSISTHPSAPAEKQPTQRSGGTGTALLPAGTEVMAMYRQFVQAMFDSSEDVGSAFADTARKIHNQEAPERPIRGHATDEECDALRDEGIPVLRLPSVKKEDLN